MEKYLKYDVKSNMKFFISTFLVFLILLVSILSIRVIGKISENLQIAMAINSMEIIVITIFLLTMVYFIINTFYKDLYTNRSILTFSLPIGEGAFIRSKLLVINIFYLSIGVFSAILLFFMRKNIDISLFIYLIFMWIIVNIVGLFILMIMQIYRYKGFYLINFVKILGLAIFIVGISFILNKYVLILSNGKIYHNNFSFFAFISPYVRINGKIYVNLTTIVYYTSIILPLFFINRSIMKKYFDLS